MSSKLYIADTTLLDDDTVFQKHYNALPAFRQEKADRLKMRKDKNLSVGAWILLEKACSDFGFDISNCKCSVTDKGKPYFEDCRFKFSLSHSGTKVMCAISDFNIGCDVEKTTAVNYAIAERYFTDDERSLILSTSDESEKNNMFFRIWTLKESFMKATGLGFSLSLKDFSITPTGNGYSLTQGVNDNGYSFFEYEIDDGYRYSCCVEAVTDEVPELVEIKL